MRSAAFIRYFPWLVPHRQPRRIIPTPPTRRKQRDILTTSYHSSMNTIILLALLAPAQASPVAFTGATIHTAAGPRIADGTLVIHKGKIVAVGGPDTPIPAG